METNETPILGVCQTPVIESRDELARCLDKAAQAAHRLEPGAPALFLFPELFWGGFDYARSQELAAASPELLHWLHRKAAERGILVAGTFWEDRDGLHNTFWLTGAGLDAPRRIRSKLQLFTLSDEQRHFTAGSVSPAPFETMGVCCGVGICFELRFPEIFRHQGAQGMELVLLSSQWPQARAAHLDTLARARAIENQCFLLSCNACGPSPAGRLGGGSRLLTPWGEDLFFCAEQPDVTCALFSREELERARKPFDTRRCETVCTISCSSDS